MNKDIHRAYGMLAGTSTRKQVVALIIIIVMVSIGGIWYASTRFSAPSTKLTTHVSQPALISIMSSGFVPATISVKTGQSVVWTNRDVMPHVVASDPYPTDNNLSSLNAKEDIAPDASYRFVFTHAGTYTYHDNLHPALRGTVLVK